MGVTIGFGWVFGDVVFCGVLTRIFILRIFWSVCRLITFQKTLYFQWVQRFFVPPPTNHYLLTYSCGYGILQLSSGGGHRNGPER